MLKERGITLEDWRLELEQGLLMEKVVRQMVYSQVRVEDSEIEAYYQEHREEFDRPAQVRARQIVLGSREEGERVLGLLRQGEPFAEVARQNSLSPDAEQGGDLGFFARRITSYNVCYTKLLRRTRRKRSRCGRHQR